jgi:TetR/AcrR family transcriptional repressor of nem operon
MSSNSAALAEELESSNSAALAKELESASGSLLTRKGQATRARIIEAAAGLVFERGIVGTSIEDVRRSAKVSGSQMAHYFQDKRSLVLAVIDYQRRAVLGFHTQPGLGRLDSFEALRLWADLNIEKLADQGGVGGCPFGSLAGELAEFDAEYRDEFADGYEQWAKLIRSGLAAMRRRGELRGDADHGMLTSVLLAAHQGGSLLSQTRRDSKPMRDALNAALDYVHSYAADGVELPRARRPRTTRERAAAPQQKTFAGSRKP